MERALLDKLRNLQALYLRHTRRCRYICDRYIKRSGSNYSVLYVPIRYLSFLQVLKSLTLDFKECASALVFRSRFLREFNGVFLSAEADEGAGAGEGLSAGRPGCVGASQRMVPDPDPQHH